MEKFINEELAASGFSDFKFDNVASTIPSVKYNYVRVSKYTYSMPKYVDDTAVLSFSAGDKKFVYAIILFGENGDTIITRPTFASADGEYRRSVVLYSKLMKKYEKFADMYAKIEKIVTPKDIELSYELSKPNKKLEKRLLDDNIVFKIFIDQWYFEGYKLSKQALENHVTPGYIDAIMTPKDVEGLVMTSEFHKFPDNSTFGIYNPDLMKLEIGSKIIPMTVGAIGDMYNMRSSLWLEIEIGRRLTDVVVSGICTSFPVMGDWFIIKTNDSFFNNENQRNKLALSDRSKRIVADIEDARRYTYSEDEVFFSFNMKTLSDSIRITEDYARNNMIYSDYSLCVLSEYCGRPLADLLWLRHNKTYSTVFEPIFSDQDILKGNLGELIYASYVLHKRVHCVHGDLHMNNIVMRGWGDLTNNLRLNVYNVADTFYTLHSSSVEMTIIDFSRSIVGKQFVHERAAIGEIGNIDHFMAWQKQKMMRVYEREFPDFTRANHDKLHFLIDSKYDDMFMSFGAYDIYRIADNFERILTTEKVDATFCRAIKNAAKSIMTIDVLGVYSDSSPRTSPHEEIFARFFAENVGSTFAKKVADYRRAKIAVTMDSLNISSNPIKYDTSRVSTLPPMAKISFFKKEKNKELVKKVEEREKESVPELPVDMTPPAKLSDSHVEKTFYFDS